MEGVARTPGRQRGVSPVNAGSFLKAAARKLRAAGFFGNHSAGFFGNHSAGFFRQPLRRFFSATTPPCPAV